MDNPFTKHPKSVNETYFQHMWQALKISAKLEWLSFCVFIHAVFPFLYKHAGSKGVQKLDSYMKDRNYK